MKCVVLNVLYGGKAADGKGYNVGIGHGLVNSIDYRLWWILDVRMEVVVPSWGACWGYGGEHVLAPLVWACEILWSLTDILGLMTWVPCLSSSRAWGTIGIKHSPSLGGCY
ncbi:hypothetical protein R6Q59_035377 [Mikania micrantha]